MWKFDTGTFPPVSWSEPISTQTVVPTTTQNQKGRLVLGDNLHFVISLFEN